MGSRRATDEELAAEAARWDRREITPQDWIDTPEAIPTMGWATEHIGKLKQGQTVQFRPHGGSMAGKIESGQLVTVEPVDPEIVQVGDIVLCSVHGTHYLHLVKAIRDGQFEIGNNKGRINGWVPPSAIYGRCIKIEP